MLDCVIRVRVTPVLTDTPWLLDLPELVECVKIHKIDVALFGHDQKLKQITSLIVQARYGLSIRLARRRPAGFADDDSFPWIEPRDQRADRIVVIHCIHRGAVDRQAIPERVNMDEHDIY